MNELYRNVSGTFFIKVLGLGITFIFQVILGRTLEPEFYGQYTMFLTYTNVLSIIAVLGMDRNLIKEVARITDDKFQCGNLLSFSIKVSLFIFVLLSLLIIIFHNSLSISLNAIHFLLMMLLINVIIVIFDGFLQGIGFIVRVTFLNTLINNILKIVFFITLIYVGVKGLNAALYSFIIGEIITIALRSVTIKKFLGNHIRLKSHLSHRDKVQYLKYSLTVALTTSMGLLIQNIDKIMIANYMDFSSVGIYKVAQNYVALIGIFISPFVAFWPMISKLYNENKVSEIEIELKKIVRIIIYLVIPMFFIFLFLNEKLLIIFGENYVTEDAKKVLIVLSFAFLVDAVSGPIGAILTMTNYAQYILINNIISLILNIIMNFVFIKMFGIFGVAIATGISIITNNLISIIEVKILLGVFSYDYKNLIQIAVSSLGNYILARWLTKMISLSNNYLYVIVFSSAVYLINLFIIFFIYRKLLSERFLSEEVG